MKVLWVHNFNNATKNSGVFMHTLHQFIINNSNIEVDLHYIGNMRHFFYYFGAALKLRRLSSQYDVIHVQYGSITSLFVGFALFNSSVQKIMHIRGSDWYYCKHRKLLKRIHSSIAVNATRWSLCFYNCIIVVSDALNQEVSSYARANVYTLPSPIDCSSFYIKNNTSNVVNHNPTKRILFAAINQGNSIKRFWLLNNALELLKQDGVQIELVTADNVDHNDMCDLYNSVDLLCLTSSHEGWPNVVKESLACGIPFVSTDVSDLHRIAQQSDGLCIISDDTPSNLAFNIKSALNKSYTTNDRNRLRDIIKGICDINKSQQQLINIYTEQIKQQ